MQNDWIFLFGIIPRSWLTFFHSCVVQPNMESNPNAWCIKTLLSGGLLAWDPYSTPLVHLSPNMATWWKVFIGSIAASWGVTVAMEICDDTAWPSHQGGFWISLGHYLQVWIFTRRCPRAHDLHPAGKQVFQMRSYVLGAETPVGKVVTDLAISCLCSAHFRCSWHWLRPIWMQPSLTELPWGRQVWHKQGRSLLVALHSPMGNADGTRRNSTSWVPTHPQLFLLSYGWDVFYSDRTYANGMNSKGCQMWGRHDCLMNGAKLSHNNTKPAKVLRNLFFYFTSFRVAHNLSEIKCKLLMPSVDEGVLAHYAWLFSLNIKETLTWCPSQSPSKYFNGNSEPHVSLWGMCENPDQKFWCLDASERSTWLVLALSSPKASWGFYILSS